MTDTSDDSVVDLAAHRAGRDGTEPFVSDLRTLIESARRGFGFGADVDDHAVIHAIMQRHGSLFRPGLGEA